MSGVIDIEALGSGTRAFDYATMTRTHRSRLTAATRQADRRMTGLSSQLPLVSRLLT